LDFMAGVAGAGLGVILVLLIERHGSRSVSE
jgi:hypothetical protein